MTKTQMACQLIVIALGVLTTASFSFAQRTIAGSIDQAASPKTESEMLAVLDSEAPLAEKAASCKLLAIHGSEAAVPQLAKLLSHPKMASWARIALEAIPAPACDAALRDAAGELDGKLLIGVINSLGVRRDKDSIQLLSNRLREGKPAVAAAAAVALGRVGGSQATTTLQSALAHDDEDVRSAVAEGCILCAENLIADGKDNKAAMIYDTVRSAALPGQRILEATRGAIVARSGDGIPLLLEQLNSDNKTMFQMALGVIRELPGDELDRALAEELPRAKPERASLLVHAMADRPDTVVVPALVTAATEGATSVRAAAIEALGKVGDESCLESVLTMTTDADDTISAAARSAVAQLPGNEVDKSILTLLPNADGERRLSLIRAVGLRRISATPALMKTLEHSDANVRAEGLAALGQTVPLEQLSVLIDRVVNLAYAEDKVAAGQALKAACIRMPDSDACATKIAEAIEKASSANTKVALLEILGEMGGPKPLAIIGDAATSSEPEIQDAATRLLGKWMTPDAAPVLIDLAKTLPSGKFRIRALRGYIRIARQFRFPNKERGDMCQAALETCKAPAEMKMVLEILQRYPNGQSLRVAKKAMEISEIRDEAKAVADAISKAIKKK